MTLQNQLSQEIPNLDSFIDPAELDQFVAECRECERVLASLRSYAEAKAGAMRLRLKGNIEGAQRFESAAETVYGRLPEWARW
jgi:hypothetical protein